MQKFLFSLFIVLFLIGCGNSQDAKKTDKNPSVATQSTAQTSSEVVKQTTTQESTTTQQVTSQQVKETIADLKNDAENIKPIKDASPAIPVNPPQTTLQTKKEITVYVHGYDNKGTTYQSKYGFDAYDPILDNFVKLTGFDTLKTYDPKNFTNILTITPYYGTQAPDYYTPEDIQDIENITKQYGGGIPRYAMIIAKYAKHAMKVTGADYVNFIGASMGALVSRWIIEKDVEHLASEHKILRWMSIEGVIRGNKMASSSNLLSIVNTVQKQPIDVEQMNYNWIKNNLHNPRDKADSPYYGTILISELSSTKSADPFGWLMSTTPNDGYQAVRDTYFASFTPQSLFHAQQPSHTYFHQTHLGIKRDKGAWANIATFFLPHKRVRVTLTDVTVNNIHEKTNYFNKRAEIVFGSEVFSPLVQQQWDIPDAISEQTYDSGRLPIRRFRKNHEHQTINQIIYDDYVLADEKTLTLTLSAYEIDNSAMYHVHDGLTKKSRLGNTSLDVNLQNGTYEISATDWSGIIKVELLPTYR